jgi:hypothetical protein
MEERVEFMEGDVSGVFIHGDMASRRRRLDGCHPFRCDNRGSMLSDDEVLTLARSAQITSNGRGGTRFQHLVEQ